MAIGAAYMKSFGSFSELISAIFRKDSQQITVRPNQTVTYTAARDVQLPPQDAASVLVSSDATQTLTNKTISGSSNTISNIGLTSQVTGVLPAANGGTGVANSNTLTYGANDIALTTSGATSVTLPTSGTLATRAGSETLTNKTIDGGSNTLQNLDLTTLKTVVGSANKAIRRDGSGVVISGNNLPNASDILTTDAAQVVTNKTITGGTITGFDGSFSIANSLDNTKIATFNTSGITTGTSRQFTFPNTSVTLAGDTNTLTFTNKSIDATTNTLSNIANASISSSAAIAYSKLNLSGSIVNADIASGAAIAYSKLSLGTSIVNADISTSAAIAYSKLNLATSIVNGDISGSAAIAYSKLNLATSIVNGDIAAAAAIARSKVATGTINHVIINDGSTGALTSEAQLAISRGGTGQGTATAAFDALSPLTTKGDVVAYDGTHNIRLAVGADGTVLTANSGNASGLGWTTPLTNPMTSVGDLIVGGSAGAATRLAFGAANTVLRTAGGTSPSWGQIVNGDISGSAAIDGAKINAATGSIQGVVSTGTQSFGGAKTFNGTITPASGIVGVTDGSSASSGIVGEFAIASLARASGTSLSTGVTKNVTSITLTAGDWDIFSGVGISASPGNNVPNGGNHAISKTSATFPAVTTIAIPVGGELFNVVPSIFTTANPELIFNNGPAPVSISTSTTFYLVTSMTFASGSVSAYGSIYARRVR